LDHYDLSIFGRVRRVLCAIALAYAVRDIRKWLSLIALHKSAFLYLFALTKNPLLSNIARVWQDTNGLMAEGSGRDFPAARIGHRALWMARGEQKDPEEQEFPLGSLRSVQLWLRLCRAGLFVLIAGQAPLQIVNTLPNQ
jgi:hypothetical protein